MRRCSIRSKIVASGGLGLAVSAMLISIMAGLDMRHQSQAQAESHLLTAAAVQEQGVCSPIAKVVDAARTLADVFASVKDPVINLDLTREAANAVLAMQLSLHPEYVSIGMVVEPNAFDNMDNAYKNT